MAGSKGGAAIGLLDSCRRTVARLSLGGGGGMRDDDAAKGGACGAGGGRQRAARQAKVRGGGGRSLGGLSMGKIHPRPQPSA